MLIHVRAIDVGTDWVTASVARATELECHDVEVMIGAAAMGASDISRHCAGRIMARWGNKEEARDAFRHRVMKPLYQPLMPHGGDDPAQGDVLSTLDDDE